MDEPTRGPVVLTDEQIEELVGAADAVEWMRQVVLAQDAGRLLAPARAHVGLGEGRMVFTTGALDGRWFGYRSYDTFDVDPGEQVVVVHSADTGRVQGIAVGSTLGRLRTGALGGLAADLLARRDATTVGVVGSGHQAWSQIWALAAVRDIEHVAVHSRTGVHAEGYARRVRDELGLRCDVVATAEEAVRERDVVVLATSSRSPVVAGSWLSPGTHVTTVGPKQQGASEFSMDLLEAADVVATDSVAQLDAYDPPAVVAASQHAERVLSLGALASGGTPGRRADADLSLYLSVGLAGTEVHLLHRALGSRG